jgi:hypothetical protein
VRRKNDGDDDLKIYEYMQPVPLVNHTLLLAWSAADRSVRAGLVVTFN